MGEITLNDVAEDLERLFAAWDEPLTTLENLHTIAEGFLAMKHESYTTSDTLTFMGMLLAERNRA